MNKPVEQPKKIRKQEFITEQEVAEVQATFADNDELLYLLRKVFLQAPLTQEEKAKVEKEFTSKPQLLSLFRKIFLHELDFNAPISQFNDLWMTIDIKDKTADEVYLLYAARAIVIDYIKGILNGTPNVEFKNLVMIDEDVDQTVINMMARNTIITHVEQQLFRLQVMAGREQESMEEAVARLKKNSSK